jgi:TolB-like protein/class 3 adenylate cyclase/Flp pilus assembly protein TadD
MGEDRVARRLAAILAADVAGYSRLMGADESGTARTLREHRAAIDQVVANHGGRIVKTTGDGILLEFPSIVAAVECAIAVQKLMARRNTDVPIDRRMLFRIGINLGDVLIEDDDILGDGVNIAARLESISEPGSIYISEAAYVQIRDKLDVKFEDIGEQRLKNISRPVRVYRFDHGGPSEFPEPDLHHQGRISIAVLPFQNLSGDVAQDYFSDGITEDIITELSRFRSLFVIARNSSFSLRGKTADVGEIGQRLGVRYAVQGSVRKAGQRVRVTVELVDTASGSHLWGERYDRELEEIFAVQDELTRAVVARLPGQIEEAGRELAKRKPTSNMTAYDLVLLGNDRWRRLTRNDLAEALNFFRRAVALDPHYARAQANMAWTQVCSVFIEVTDVASLGEALRFIERSLDIDDSDGWSHGVYAQLLFLLRRDDEAEIHFKRALALNPNDADVTAVFANILVYWGRWREALTWIDSAKRLNPLAPNLYHWYHALTLYSGREYEQAVKVLKQMRSPDRWSHCLLAACYAQTGRLDEARSELEVFITERERELKERGETLPRNRLELALSRADRYRNPSDREHFLDGLRKAGLTG